MVHTPVLKLPRNEDEEGGGGREVGSRRMERNERLGK